MKIKGKELSEQTIAAACEAYGISFEEPEYQFQAGDVARSGGDIRIVVEHNDELLSFDKAGFYQNRLQEHFVSNSYKKIGKLKDFIK